MVYIMLLELQPQLQHQLNGTVWSWIIVVAVVLGIAFLIWYLVKRNHNE